MTTHFAPPEEPTVLLVCSSGGHLTQLYNLRPWWERFRRVWVTFDKEDARSILRDETIIAAHHPTTRNIPNLLRNSVLAWRVLRRHRPDVIVSTGAGVALPFFLLGRILGIRTIYIEVFDRIDAPSLTARLCYPLSDLFALQWEEQARFFPRGKVVGALF
jgi:UDP-N-acetylglucosamine:LPS N-acetylglucosamine transferase